MASLNIQLDEAVPDLSAPPLWRDSFFIREGVPHTRLFRLKGELVMEALSAGCFRYVGPELKVSLYAGGDSPVPYLLGRVFALWLELQGLPVLHGCCFRSDGMALGLIGDSGAGKSTLGAAVVAAGLPLLTDDLIPIHIEGDDAPIFPGIAMSRLWPDTGASLVPNFEQTERIHPMSEKRKLIDDGRRAPRFAHEAAPLRHLFVLKRGEGPIQRTRLAPAAALMALIQYSYRPEMTQALGLQPQRLQVLARLLRHVAVHELVYPNGFEHLPAVVEALRQVRQANAPAFIR